VDLWVGLLNQSQHHSRHFQDSRSTGIVDSTNDRLDKMNDTSDWTNIGSTWNNLPDPDKTHQADQYSQILMVKWLANS